MSASDRNLRSNTDARRATYDKLRTALNDGTPLEKRRAEVAQRIASPPNHPKPSRTEKIGADMVVQFRGYLEGQSAVVVEVPTKEAIPGAIAQYLRSQNLAMVVRSGADPYFADVPWAREATLTINHGQAHPKDETGLAHARAGISETGTLVLTSGAENPVTLNFLPETHIVVIEERDIVGSYESAWGKIRERFGKGLMSRTVNFISGPSRTGDIGGRIVMGAHGPRRMCVVIVKG